VEHLYLTKVMLVQVIEFFQFFSYWVHIDLQLHKVKASEIADKRIQKSVYDFWLFEHCDNTR
jgi:hypothetical protein